jgi:hypothetical protein
LGRPRPGGDDVDRDEAIRLLKGGPEGVREWNEQREQGEEIPLLYWADLGRTVLDGAHLSGAILRAAILHAAILRGADLRGAVLRRAVLDGADLSDTDLIHAILRGADLSDVKCESTVFGDVDLSEAKGLESIHHLGPSTVGVDTLLRSRGRIPEAFLRGCGVPNAQVTYLLSLFRGVEPIQFYSCFISYSTEDQDFAERLHSRLRDKGLRVWFSPADARWGEPHYEQIDEAIRVHDKLLLVLSPASLASKWVRVEIRKALKAEREEGRRKLFPIRLMDFEAIQDWEYFDEGLKTDLGMEIRKYLIPDFSNWKDHDAFEATFARLIENLKAATPPGGPTPSG